MNIFVLDLDTEVCARYHCDKHVVKMILETAQILSTSFRAKGLDYKWMYRSTHANHPCVIWAGESLGNLKWLIDLGIHLSREYTARYGKKHKTSPKFFLFRHHLKKLENRLPDKMTDFALAMPEDVKEYGDAVQSYRSYYTKYKSHILTWKNQDKPNWI